MPVLKKELSQVNHLPATNHGISAWHLCVKIVTNRSKGTAWKTLNKIWNETTTNFLYWSDVSMVALCRIGAWILLVNKPYCQHGYQQVSQGRQKTMRIPRPHYH